MFWRLNVSLSFTEKSGGRSGVCLLGFRILHHFLTRKELLESHVTELALGTHIFFEFFVAMIRGILDSGVMVNL